MKSVNRLVWHPTLRNTRQRSAHTQEGGPHATPDLRTCCAAVAGLLAALLLATPGPSPAAVARHEQAACTFPPPGQLWLPESCLHGPIEYLREYPDMRLATPAQRAFARSLHDRLIAAAREENWRDVRAAADLGYRMNVGPRKPGDRLVHYFHAGSSPSQARKYGLLNARHPKALIYANAPGRPLVLVGAMWTMPPESSALRREASSRAGTSTSHATPGTAWPTCPGTTRTTYTT